jgi:DNA replication protein DnaC
MARECAICSGTGYALHENEGGVLTSVRCECEKAKRSGRLLSATGIPERYAHCSFDAVDQQGGFQIHNPTHKSALAVCRAWAETFPGNPEDPDLMLVGPPGRGKTHLAVAAARYLVEHKGVRVRFYEQRALLKALQGTFGSGSGQQESDVLGPVQDCELLVLDDLGAGRTTEWAKDVLHDIISHRYNTRKHMLVTTNIALGDDDRRRSRSADAPLTLADRLGDALISRMREMCRIVELEGPDYRKDILSQNYRY